MEVIQIGFLTAILTGYITVKYCKDDHGEEYDTIIISCAMLFCGFVWPAALLLYTFISIVSFMKRKVKRKDDNE